MVCKFLIHHLSFIIRKSVGFTLIELMVAISITAVLGTLGIAGFVNYNQIQVLQTSTNEVVTMLNLAKSRAQSQIKPPLCTNALDGYKVKINSTSPGSYNLYASCGLSGDISIYVPDKKLPTGISFGASASYFFPVQTGGMEVEDSLKVLTPPFSGPWQITISNSNGSDSETVFINALGGVMVQPKSCPNWDINCDHIVDQKDLNFLNANYKKVGSLPGWIRADVKKDTGNVVNLYDLGVISGNWNKTW